MGIEDINYRGLKLRVHYIHHPKQEQGLEQEGIEEHIEVESISYKDNDSFEDVIEALDDMEVLTDEVFKQIKEG